MPELFYRWQLADELLTETECLIAEASSRVNDKEGPGPTDLQIEIADNLRQTVRECLSKAGGSIVDAPNALSVFVATRELLNMQSGRGELARRAIAKCAPRAEFGALACAQGGSEIER